MRMVAAVESIRGSNQPLVSVILEVTEIFGDREIGILKSASIPIFEDKAAPLAVQWLPMNVR